MNVKKSSCWNGRTWIVVALKGVLFVVLASAAQSQADNGTRGNTLVADPTAPIVHGQVADRALVNFPVLFTKRFNYQGLHIYDTFYQWRPGGGIYLLENPAAPQEQQRIRTVIDPQSAETLGDGIYFDPALSYDAKTILFCFKGSEKGNSVIYEIGVDGKGLRQLTNLDASGNPYRGSGGGHHDVKPCYLPDGRIVFTSTRYSGLVPCANNGVAILHVMNADGSDIHAISVNNVTEFDPCVLPDGRILFGRWEYVDRNALVIQSLWSILPDGRNEMAVYANNMVFPEAVLQAKPVPGSPELVCSTFAPHNAPPRGSIAMIDTGLGKNDPAAAINFEHPEKPLYDRGESCDPVPLNAARVLYSGIPDDAAAPKIAHNPAFRKRSNDKLNALMLIDRTGKKIVIHSDPGIDLHNPIPLLPRSMPRLQPDMIDRSQNSGNFYVNDVYSSMPQVKRGSVKWLRVLEETSRVTGTPGANTLNQTFPMSAAMAWSAKIYHGIVPVDPDGSVYFVAPSGRALYFQLLDADYRLVRGMRTFVKAAQGITRGCTGCHDYNPAITYSRRLAGRKPLKLVPESWGSGYIEYARQIQPILDKHCVECHGGPKGLAKGLDLSGGWTKLFNISYDHLAARREKMYTADLIQGICCMNGTAYWSCKVFAPYAHGSGNAPLAELMLKAPHKGLLNPTERELLFAWIDSNGSYYGTWNYTEGVGAVSVIYQDACDAVKGVMKIAGCIQCHATAKGEIKRFDNWINLEKPEMSLVLRAPLPESQNAETGYGLALCRQAKVVQDFSRKGLLYSRPYEHAVKPLDSFPVQAWPTTWPTPGEKVCPFASVKDVNYQKMLAIITDARQKQLKNPRIDMPTAGIAKPIIAGRPRQMIPQPLPDTSRPVTFTAVALADGAVRIDWERSARTLGLVSELYRGPKGFVISEKSLVARTEGFCLVDNAVPAGDVEYALVLLSDPGVTCGSTKISQEAIAACQAPEARPTTAVSIPASTTSESEHCASARFAIQRSEPIRCLIQAQPTQ